MRRCSIRTCATVALLLVAAASVSAQGAVYDAAKALAWVRKMGCDNATMTSCPGGRQCTDAEFYARALAAGGVVELDPDDPSGAPYHDYKGYILAEATGLLAILPQLGFDEVAPSSFPVGSIVWTTMWPPGMPYFANGAGLCDSHTPLLQSGPHCSIDCNYLVPRSVFVPNGQPASVGSAPPTTAPATTAAPATTTAAPATDAPGVPATTAAPGAPPPTTTTSAPAPVPAGTYDAAKALAWVRKMGCANGTVTNCPGRACTDAEFYARALAAGGVVELDPDTADPAPYHDYKGYILAEATGLLAILPRLGFTQYDASEVSDYPLGSIAWTTMWPPGMPYFAVGNNLCDSHTPILEGGPHCNMPCTSFVPRIVFVPNGQPVNVPPPLPPSTATPRPTTSSPVTATGAPQGTTGAPQGTPAAEPPETTIVAPGSDAGSVSAASSTQVALAALLGGATLLAAAVL